MAGAFVVIAFALARGLWFTRSSQLKISPNRIEVLPPPPTYRLALRRFGKVCAILAT